MSLTISPPWLQLWATDELLANFFQVTCPYLHELDTIAYFALTRGRHAHQVVAAICDTTQVLIDVFRARAAVYVHPLKVWLRYAPAMFLPHRVLGETWAPILQVEPGFGDEKATPGAPPWGVGPSRRGIASMRSCSTCGLCPPT
jgi:hypothetical protein